MNPATFNYFLELMHEMDGLVSIDGTSPQTNSNDAIVSALAKSLEDLVK